MSTVKIYGIKNCDTMKKAFNWLDKNGISYDFHDYKKEGAVISILQQTITAHGWENVINRRGTSWRKLPDDVKNKMDEKSAIEIALQNPSLIKRPLLIKSGKTYLGFSEEHYKEIF